MTYQEIKDRLSKCEYTLKCMKDGTLKDTNQKTVKKLELLKESLENQLKEQEAGMVVTRDSEEAEKLAGQAALRLLSTISHYCDGDLDKVDQMIKVVGIVNGTPDFIGHGKVVNGASDMFVEVLGDRGRHARTCTGAGSLPAAVTVEYIVRLKD